MRTFNEIWIYIAIYIWKTKKFQTKVIQLIVDVIIDEDLDINAIITCVKYNLYTSSVGIVIFYDFSKWLNGRHF